MTGRRFAALVLALGLALATGAGSGGMAAARETTSVAVNTGALEPLPPAIHYGDTPIVDLIVLDKSERRLDLMSNGRVARRYRVALGRNPTGPKMIEGDARTPEGLFYIDERKEDSGFHRALKISYPRPEDRELAARFGRSPGGQIMIHGLPNGRDAAAVGHPWRDWTLGCIALTNEEMTEVFSLVIEGTPVWIVP